MNIEFDLDVYNDAELTEVATGPFNVTSSTNLPNLFYQNAEYVGTGRNIIGDVLWTVRFTYPDHVVNNVVNVLTGGVFDG